jgi:hypothetical protein
MKITYYKKFEGEGFKIGSFGISIPQWGLKINNLAVIRGKDNGWFTVMPTFKEDVEWVKTVEFEGNKQKVFNKAVRETLEEYMREKEISI